jgi:hypothetical protein
MRGIVFDIQTMATPAPRQDSSTDAIRYVYEAIVKCTTTKKEKTKAKQNNKSKQQRQ